MYFKTIGFIGGGRIIKIILNGWKNSSIIPNAIMVTDTDIVALDRIKAQFPDIETSLNAADRVARADLIFLAIHPPVMKSVLNQIKDIIRKNSVLVSLAPIFSVKNIQELVGFETKIVRMIPNANSYINRGFNPTYFSKNIPDSEKLEIKKILSTLGDMPEVDEEKLEGYAIITGMGPTYFWFQFATLFDLAREFGLSNEEAKVAIENMICSSVKNLFNSGLSFDEVIDLIPVRPLKDNEVEIVNTYKVKLTDLYKKLTHKK